VVSPHLKDTEAEEVLTRPELIQDRALAGDWLGSLRSNLSFEMKQLFC
jgi:hypothetical protein